MNKIDITNNATNDSRGIPGWVVVAIVLAVVSAAGVTVRTQWFSASPDPAIEAPEPAIIEPVD